MKELEYPFDAAYIIKKRKSLKKALLADGTSRIRKKIAVFGGSTTSDIVKTLELFLLDAGIEPEFYESEYAQYFQDAMFPDETLLSFKPDIVFIHTTNRNVTDWPEMTDVYKRQELRSPIHGFCRFVLYLCLFAAVPHLLRPRQKAQHQKHRADCLFTHLLRLGRAALDFAFAVQFIL